MRLWALGLRSTLGFALAGLIMLALAVATAWQIERTREILRIINVNNEIVAEFDTLHDDVGAASSAVRSYLLTRRNAALMPYYRARFALPPRVDELKRNLHDEPALAAGLDDLTPHLSAVMMMLDHAVERAVDADPDGAVDVLPPETDPNSPERVGASLRSLRDRAEQTLASNLDARQELFRSILILIFSGALVALSLVTFGLGALNRSAMRRRGVEDDLRRSEDELRSLYNLSSSAKAVLDTATGRILSANRTLGDLLGYDASELQGMSLLDLAPPGERAELQTLLTAWARRGDSDWTLERRLRTRAGETRWVQLYGTLLREEGQALRALVLLQDVTKRREDETHARLEKERLASALAASRTGTFQWSASTNEGYWDENFHRIVGLEPTTAPHTVEDFLALVHPDDVAAFRSRGEATIGQGTDFEHEFRVVRPDGAVRWILERARTVYDDAGAARYVAGAAVDVTDRRQAEEALRHREEWLRLAIESTDIGTWDWYPLTGEMQLSASARELFGLDADAKASHEALNARIHPADRERVAGETQAALDRANDGRTLRTEYRVVDLATGGERWVALSGRVLFDDAWRPARVIGTVSDITDRKHRDEAVAQRATLLKERADLLDLSPDGIFVLDTERRIVFWSQGAVTMYGWTREEAYGRKVEALLRTELPRPREEIDAVLYQSGRWEGEVRHHRRDGARLVVYSRWALQHDHRGVPTRILESNTDMTTRKATEEALDRARVQAEAANQAKSRFIANMSHELRTPLGVIRGFAELLQQPNVTGDQQQKWTRAILRNADQLTAIVDDVLDLARIEADRLEVRRDAVELEPLLEDLRSSLAPKAKDKGLALSVELVRPAPARVETDAMRLRQILMNLVGNALKFTAQGAVGLRVAVKDGTLEALVTDTGPGFAPEAKRDLFQAFAQGDDSMTRRYGGTGLGLHVSRRLARLLGGDLELVASEPGAGSTFRLRVPAPGVTPHAQSPAEAVAAAPGAERLAGRRVLLVEDNEDNRWFTAHALRNAGAAVDEAENGEDGVARAQREDYDVILMDLQMPGLDGYAATERLRRSGYRKPIVAVTAHALKTEREKCLRAGFDEHVAKPVDQASLIETLVAHAAKADRARGRPAH